MVFCIVHLEMTSQVGFNDGMISYNRRTGKIFLFDVDCSFWVSRPKISSVGNILNPFFLKLEVSPTKMAAHLPHRM